MAENVYLKTVSFGGFDKKEVLAYIDKLYSNIYKLEAELKEKNELIESLQGGEIQSFDGKEDLEAKIDESKSKISELMASNDTLKLQIANFESDEAEKNNQISSLESEVEDLKDKLENIDTTSTTSVESEFDIGSVFIEAKKSADRVVIEAKKAAKKMEEDAAILQNQMLDEANEQAESIVTEAQTKATTTIDEANAQAQLTISDANELADETLTNANSESERIRDNSSELRNSVQAEFEALDQSVEKISTVLRELFGDNMVKLDSAKELVEQGLELVNNGDSNFNGISKGSGALKVEEKPEEKDNKNLGINVAEEVNDKDDDSIDDSEESTIEEETELPQPQIINDSELDELARLAAAAEMAVYDEGQEFIDDETVADIYEEEQSEDEVIEEEKADEEVVEDNSEYESPKPSNFSKSFDLDMLSALTKEIESKENDEDISKLSDDEILEKYSK